MGVTIVVDPRVGEELFAEQMMLYKPQVTVMTGCWWLSFFRLVEKKMKQGEKVDLSFLRMPTVGGDGVTVKELQWMNSILKQCNSQTMMFCGYGMSEVFSTISIDKLNNRDDIVRNKDIASVGIPYPEVVIGVFDNNGNELPFNTRGELWIKTASRMKGYYGKPDLTEKAICGEWVKTGDYAEISPDGELYVWGRMSNYIEVGNKEIYFFDIEKEIRTIDEVANVKVVAPTGSKNEIAVHIVLTPGADKDTVIEEINGKLKSIYGSELVVKGYKVWDVALPSSGTTAKYDTAKMANFEEYS